MNQHNSDSDINSADGPALRLLFWEATAACNLACVHCRRLDVAEQLCRDDMTTDHAMSMIRSLPQIGKPILVFSGGEPLMRPDLLELAAEARNVGLPTALATNGTIMNDDLAKRIVDVGIRRTSISFDGPDAATHDSFRGIDGAFDATLRGFTTLRNAGMSMQINTTISRHNYKQLDEIYQLALDLGADAFHLFMLVPVGCGMELSDEIMLSGQEYENALNWVYDRSLENKLHLKATCAPHYFRVVRQRTKADGRPMPKRNTHGGGHPGGHPSGDQMTAITKGCLAGQSVCFVSHTGEVFPCGYLPISSGNVKTTPLEKIWTDSPIFAKLRNDDNIEGKCGCCEYKTVCMGCRARAYAATGDYLAEEPNCGYKPVRIRNNSAD